MVNSKYKLGFKYILEPRASGTGTLTSEADLADPNMIIIRAYSKYLPKSENKWYLDTKIMPADLSSLKLVKHENIKGQFIVTLIS